MTALPVEMVEVRPGRELAVHSRIRPEASYTLIFVHGSAASMLQWRDQIDHFSATHSVVAFDTYGCGRSPKPESWGAYSFHELAADLAAILIRFACPGTHLVVVAHSAGCSLAISAAAAGLANTKGPKVGGLCLLGGYVDAPTPHPVFYLPVTVLRLIQPILSSGFEVTRCQPRTPLEESPFKIEHSHIRRRRHGRGFICSALTQKASSASRARSPFACPYIARTSCVACWTLVQPTSLTGVRSSQCCCMVDLELTNTMLDWCLLNSICRHSRCTRKRGQERQKLIELFWRLRQR